MQDNVSRNPKWTRDEIILALNTYFKLKTSILSTDKEAPVIVELSELLQKLNAYGNSKRTDSYRNSSGVKMKLINFCSIEFPGKGLQNASKLDRQIYSEFENDKAQLNSIAEKIIGVINSGNQIEPSYEDEGFVEGAVLEKQHKCKERSSKVVRTKKQKVLSTQGFLRCEICGFIYKNIYGELGDGYIECHHIVPLVHIEIERETKLEDLALVCANCHRMLHRKRPWIEIQELKNLVDRYKLEL